MKHYETIIIGAGPCGLATAIELEKANRSYVVFEKGNIVEAIYQYPTHQTFFSSSDKLSIGEVPFITERHKPTRNDALVYYRAVAKHYNLNIRAYEEVLNGKKENDKFFLTTKKGEYSCDYLVLATGYYDQHNDLNIPGSHLSKVKHYFKEAHPYYNQNVLVIGGKNSSVDSALELEKAGAKVTVVYRGNSYSESIKPWILPQFKSLVNNGKIKMLFNTRVEMIDEHTVTLNTNGCTTKINNDFVFAMIGYHPNYHFLKSLGIHIKESKSFKYPDYNDYTYETNIKNLYVAGVVASGDDANKIFIENGRYHGSKIVKDILRKETINHTI